MSTSDPKSGLLDDEKACALALADAWNRFIQLDEQHPDDTADFRRAIHQAQRVVATRVTRRTYPDFWPIQKP